MQYPTHADLNDAEDWSGIAEELHERIEPLRMRIGRFSRHMLRKLLFNYDKGGWSPHENPFLIAKLIEEVIELTRAMQRESPNCIGSGTVDSLRAALRAQRSLVQALLPELVKCIHDDDRPGELISEAGDVANIAMMLADNHDHGGYVYVTGTCQPDATRTDAIAARSGEEE